LKPQLICFSQLKLDFAYTAGNLTCETTKWHFSNLVVWLAHR